LWATVYMTTSVGADVRVSDTSATVRRFRVK
jgi:hypothetical protein